MRTAEADLVASRKACHQLEAQLKARDKEAEKVQKAAEAARGEAWEAEALRAQVRNEAGDVRQACQAPQAGMPLKALVCRSTLRYRGRGRIRQAVVRGETACHPSNKAFLRKSEISSMRA